MNTQTLWIIVIGSILATFVWRFLGAVVVRKIPAQGDLFEWVTCVSYAMVAGLVFRMIILPQSDLATLSIGIRVSAVVIAFAAYFLFKRNLLAGVVAGGVSLSLMASSSVGIISF
ncbi:MAG: AzlD domain-containing protein [Gammaproteobacteria bacterium]|nr:AzlD domain-containing protein [Gammaproteobacteria bacterium]